MGPTNLARIAIALERIANNQSDTAKIEKIQAEYKEQFSRQGAIYRKTIAHHCETFSNDLEYILDKPINDFDKAKELRNLFAFWTKKAEELRNG